MIVLYEGAVVPSLLPYASSQSCFNGWILAITISRYYQMSPYTAEVGINLRSFCLGLCATLSALGGPRPRSPLTLPTTALLLLAASAAKQ